MNECSSLKMSPSFQFIRHRVSFTPFFHESPFKERKALIPVSRFLKHAFAYELSQPSIPFRYFSYVIFALQTYRFLCTESCLAKIGRKKVRLSVQFKLNEFLDLLWRGNWNVQYKYNGVHAGINELVCICVSVSLCVCVCVEIY